MTPKNEFERDFQFYMVLAQLKIREAVRKILAEQDFEKIYKEWEGAE